MMVAQAKTKTEEDLDGDMMKRNSGSSLTCATLLCVNMILNVLSHDYRD